MVSPRHNREIVSFATGLSKESVISPKRKMRLRVFSTDRLNSFGSSSMGSPGAGCGVGAAVGVTGIGCGVLVGWGVGVAVGVAVGVGVGP